MVIMVMKVWSPLGARHGVKTKTQSEFSTKWQRVEKEETDLYGPPLRGTRHGAGA